MLRRPPVLDPAQLPGRKRKSWPSLAMSAGAHVLVILLAIGLFNKKEDEKKDDTSEKPKQVDMIYLPRPKVEKPLPKPPEPPKPVPPTARTPTKLPDPPATKNKPEPDPNAPADATPQKGNVDPQTEQPKGAPPADGGQKATEKPSLSTAPLATQESEAKRLFGPTPLADGQEPEAISVRPFAFPGQGSEKCEPIERFKRDANGKAPMGTTEGRVLRDDGKTPLGGALLQMIGTPYVTYTDDNGEYKFTYDLSLIEDCRQQFVRVSAKGYESRMLVLMIGKGRSDDVALPRAGGLPFNIRPGGRRN